MNLTEESLSTWSRRLGFSNAVDEYKKNGHVFYIYWEYNKCYGNICRSWEIDGKNKTTVKSKYGDSFLEFECSNGLIGERAFENNSIEYEFLIKPLGLENECMEGYNSKFTLSREKMRKYTEGYVEKEIARDPLYDLSCDELLNMAREKGIKFPLNYQLPYNHQGYIKRTPFDARFKYGVRNDKELREAEERGADLVEVVTIRHYQNPWYNIFGRVEAKKQINDLNKRHLIVAMQSENPNFPVLL
jgi:hypothetical protein